MPGGSLRVVHLGQRQHPQLAAAQDADVELAAGQEALDQGGLLEGVDDLAHLFAQGLFRRHHRIARDADAGVFLARMHDQREMPFVVVDLGDPFQEGRVAGNGNAGARAAG